MAFLPGPLTRKPKKSVPDVEPSLPKPRENRTDGRKVTPFLGNKEYAHRPRDPNAILPRGVAARPIIHDEEGILRLMGQNDGFAFALSQRRRQVDRGGIGPEGSRLDPGGDYGFSGPNLPGHRRGNPNGAKQTPQE